MVKYILAEPSKREKASGRKSSNNSNGKSAEANYKESLVEHKMNWLAKLDPSSSESAELLAELTLESSKADQIQVRGAVRVGIAMFTKREPSTRSLAVLVHRNENG
jgi:hypothetical protein